MSYSLQERTPHHSGKGPNMSYNNWIGNSISVNSLQNNSNNINSSNINNLNNSNNNLNTNFNNLNNSNSNISLNNSNSNINSLNNSNNSINGFIGGLNTSGSNSRFFVNNNNINNNNINNFNSSNNNININNINNSNSNIFGSIDSLDYRNKIQQNQVYNQIPQLQQQQLYLQQQQQQKILQQQPNLYNNHNIHSEFVINSSDEIKAAANQSGNTNYLQHQHQHQHQQHLLNSASSANNIINNNMINNSNIINNNNIKYNSLNGSTNGVNNINNFVNSTSNNNINNIDDNNIKMNGYNNSSLNNNNSNSSLGLRPISPSNISQLFSISQIVQPSLPSSNDFLDKFSANSFDFGLSQPQFFTNQAQQKTIQQIQQLQQLQAQQQQQQQQQQFNSNLILNSKPPQSPQLSQQQQLTSPQQNSQQTTLTNVESITSQIGQIQIQQPQQQIQSPTQNSATVIANAIKQQQQQQLQLQQQQAAAAAQAAAQQQLQQQLQAQQQQSPKTQSNDNEQNQIQPSISSSSPTPSPTPSPPLSNSQDLSNFLDETNFPTLNTSKDLRKSQTNNTAAVSVQSPTTNGLSLSQDEKLKASNSITVANKKKENSLSSSKDGIITNGINSQLNKSSNIQDEKIKLSWFEFQSLSNSINEGEDDDQPSRVLWVGNIGMDVSEEDLKYEFGSFGELESVRILHNKYCAFVNFKDTNDAVEAKKGMHNQVLGSQYIVVNFRHPKNDDILGAPAVPITTPETLNSISRAIYIGNVSDNLPEKDIRKECEKYGEIESIRILRKKACAFVNFTNIPNATAALQALNGKKLGDTIVRVNYGKVSSTSAPSSSSTSSSNTASGNSKKSNKKK